MRHVLDQSWFWNNITRIAWGHATSHQGNLIARVVFNETNNIINNVKFSIEHTLEEEIIPARVMPAATEMINEQESNTSPPLSSPSEHA